MFVIEIYEDRILIFLIGSEAAFIISEDLIQL